MRMAFFTRGLLPAYRLFVINRFTASAHFVSCLLINFILLVCPDKCQEKHHPYLYISIFSVYCQAPLPCIIFWVFGGKDTTHDIQSLFLSRLLPSCGSHHGGVSFAGFGVFCRLVGFRFISYEFFGGFFHSNVF